ncbi:hypothetical protein CKAH01_14669 [Colletotrichum kahawae]|uniref:Uncharacterized protein n=1 Tax=Colletotrichum kahawae TaxID=34407 RepID=A0AAE0D9A2_COLKA|nr:hypothetical protein CKAH01_14669 [Colletotrichum kahawae]
MCCVLPAASAQTGCGTMGLEAFLFALITTGGLLFASIGCECPQSPFVPHNRLVKPTTKSS